MLLNFTLQDILGTAFAVFLFPLVIVFPGYVFGWIFNLFNFRARFLATRFAISLLLSVSISPVLYYLIASWFSLNVALMVTILIALAFVVLFFIEKRDVVQKLPWPGLFFIFLGWAILAMFSLIDLQWGRHELYYTAASFDYSTRVSVIDAMTRTGVPPVNPSYYPGHYVKLTFLYFFWYILGGIVDTAGGNLIDARAALFASIIWCGFALMALVAFYLRLRDGLQEGPRIWRRALIGMASISITGLDIIPAGIFMILGGGLFANIEHWNELIAGWINSILWVPHHIAGLIAGVTGVMLLYSVRQKPGREQSVAMAFSGVAFASALGLSVWVTFIFVLFWGIWMLFLYVQNEERKVLLPMLLAGLVALIVSLPFLLGLLSGGSGQEAGTWPVALTIRAFRFTDALIDSPVWLKYLVRVAVLPINYFLELGFFMFVAIIWFKNNGNTLRQNPLYFAEALLLIVSFVVGTFTRSNLIANNDLGWRAWLPGQFILLIWGVDVLEGMLNSRTPRLVLSTGTKRGLVLLAVIGFSSTMLDITLNRFYDYFSLGAEKGHEIYSARQAYTTINKVAPANAIVQYNPSGIMDRPVGMYGMHQSSISDRTAYGIQLEEYKDRISMVSTIFTDEDISGWSSLDTLCSLYYIDIVVITNRDPVWKSVGFLKKYRTPIYADEYTAAFFCGEGK